MPRTTSFTLALIAAASLGAGGCTTYDAPTLDVTGVTLTQSTPDGVAIEFAIDAHNTNEVELPLRELRYDVYINGRRVFSGVRSPEAALRRLGTQRILAPASVPRGEKDGVSEIPTGVAECRIEGTLKYITPGRLAELFFDVGAQRPTVGFKGRGSVDFGAGLDSARAAPAPAAQ